MYLKQIFTFILLIQFFLFTQHQLSMYLFKVYTILWIIK